MIAEPRLQNNSKLAAKWRQTTYQKRPSTPESTTSETTEHTREHNIRAEWEWAEEYNVATISNLVLPFLRSLRSSRRLVWLKRRQWEKTTNERNQFQHSKQKQNKMSLLTNKGELKALDIRERLALYYFISPTKADSHSPRFKRLHLANKGELRARDVRKRLTLLSNT